MLIFFANFRKISYLFKKLENNKLLQLAIKKATLLMQINISITKKEKIYELLKLKE